MLFGPGSKIGVYSSFRRRPELRAEMDSGLRRNAGLNTLPIYQIGISDHFETLLLNVGYCPQTL